MYQAIEMLDKSVVNDSNKKTSQTKNAFAGGTSAPRRRSLGLKNIFNLGQLLLLLAIFAGACRAIPGTLADGAGAPTLEAGQTPGAVEQNQISDTFRLRQWALSAEASSEFSVPEWAAEQAVGPPDAPGCGDYQFAWASAASDEIATLELTYGTPIYITEIVIIQSFNPDQVVKVEVLNPDDEFQLVYEKVPKAVDRPCPYTLSILVGDLGYKSNKIRLTVDQSLLGLGWNEIDAVQLLGVLEE